MRISYQKIPYNNCNGVQKSVASRPLNPVNAQDVFLRSAENYSPSFTSITANILGKLLPSPINRFKDYSIREYKSLSDFQKNILRLQFNKYLRTDINFEYNKLLQLHNDLAECAKTALNKKYGKDNYVVLIMGRSLSSVGKVLGYKIGEDKVKNIPFSLGQRFMSNRPKTKEDIAPFVKVLSDMGLDKSTVRNSNKKYVIMDYANTGESLIGAKQLLTNDKIFGKSSNIVTEDFEATIPFNNTDLRIFYNEYLWSCSLKKFSFVKRSTSLEKSDSSFVNTKKEPMTTKLIWFKLLDNEMLRQNNQQL